MNTRPEVIQRESQDEVPRYHTCRRTARTRPAELSVAPIFFFPLIAGWAGTPEEPKLVEQPSVKTTEPWQITVDGSGWLAGFSGHTGFHGVNPYVNVGVGQILRHINVISLSN